MLTLYQTNDEKIINLLFSYGAIFTEELNSEFNIYNKYSKTFISKKNQSLQKLWDVYNTPDGKCASKKK
jgi:hypothetical protein